jgi:hypothetical protein
MPPVTNATRDFVAMFFSSSEFDCERDARSAAYAQRKALAITTSVMGFSSRTEAKRRVLPALSGEGVGEMLTHVGAGAKDRCVPNAGRDSVIRHATRSRT